MDQEACTVQGIFAMILYMSSALGATPVRLARVRGGYQATMSRPAAAYCCILTFSYHLCGVTTMILKILQSYEQNTPFPMEYCSIPIVMILLTGVGSYGGLCRVRRMISHLAQLQKINYDINGNFNKKQNKKAFLAISTFMAVWVVLFVFTAYFSNQENNLLTVITSSIFCIECYNFLLLKMENLAMNFEIHCVVRAITMELRTIHETNPGNASPAACRSASRSVHDLMKSYVSCCELVRELNASHGLLLYLLFSTNLLIFMFTICNIINASLYTEGFAKNIAVCLQLLWCGCHLLDTVLYIEPWHLIREEVAEIRTLVTQLMYNMTPFGKSVPLQLDLMFKQLLLNEPTLTPLRMFTVQRSLLTTAVGLVNTYLVILIQCFQKRWEKYH